MKKNVLEFMNQCGNSLRNNFINTMEFTFWYHKIESPIEQLFYTAFVTIQKHLMISFCDCCKIGLCISPQKKINQFRVDFLVQYLHENKKREIIVECDSQQFHEKTEQERQYEEQRDKFLQSRGYKIFRFTGSEIYQKPLKCAAEVIAYSIEILTAEEILKQVENYIEET